MVVEARDGGCEGEELVREGGCEGLELGVVGVLGVIGAAPCCWLGWEGVSGSSAGSMSGGGCVYIRALGYLGRTWWEAVEVAKTIVDRVLEIDWESVSLLLATLFTAME